MGASTWISFTPYQPKPSAALRQLREQVFALGQFRKPATVQERLNQLGPLPLPSQQHRQWADQLKRSLGAYSSPEMEQAIVRAEQLAEEALKREPEYSRFMEALKAGTLDRLPDVLEWNRAAQLAFGPAPQVPVKGSGRGSRKLGSVTAEIAKLLMQAKEQGTHSVLDILWVGKKASHAAATELPANLLLETFGTIEPTRQQVETTDLKFVEELHWQAVYFAVYQGGSPSQWAFVGSSGD